MPSPVVQDQMILLTILSHYICHTREEVKQAWKKGNSRDHLSKKNTETRWNACPNAECRPICCPCMGKGLTHNMLLSNRPTLILAPSHLISTWIYEWDQTLQINLTEDLGPPLTLLGGHNTIETARSVGHCRPEALKDNTRSGSHIIVLTTPESYSN